MAIYKPKWKGKEVKKNCDNCGEPFVVTSARKRFCFYDCRTSLNRKSKFKKDGLSSGVVGALTEMLVIADLLKKGYAVFRAVSQSCFCDLIAIKGEEKMLVEARTGYRSNNGTLCFSQMVHTKGEAKPTHFAVYVHEKDEIYYEEIK